MKIYEILSEGPTDDVGDVAQLSVNNVASGYDKVNKLLSPGQWFKSKNVDIGKGGDGAKTSAPTKQAPTKQAPTHLNKQSLVNAATGKQLYRDDVVRLKNLAAQYDQGTAEAQALQAAYSLQQLSKDQQQILLNISKKY
jgi:hypothetical protein